MSKRNFAKKNKYFYAITLLILCIGLILFSVYGKNGSQHEKQEEVLDSEINITDEKEEANTNDETNPDAAKEMDTALYESFLKGETDATDKDGQLYNIADFYRGGHSERYIYMDIDGDAREELHIMSTRYYYVLKRDNNALKVLYDGSTALGDNYPVNHGELCGVLSIVQYWRTDGVPTGKEYQFTTFTPKGQSSESAWIAWSDDNENGIMDTKDHYQRGNEEISIEEWNLETEGYRENEDVKEEWRTAWHPISEIADEALGSTEEPQAETDSEAYELFLKNEINAVNKEGERYRISDWITEEDNAKYNYCDIDGDGREELHIYSPWYYYVLKYDGAVLKIFYEGSRYEFPVNEEELCGILYIRPGGAPTHRTYKFTTFTPDGKITESSWYTWGDMNENGVEDEEDWYLKDNKDIDREVWNRETEAYRKQEGKDNVWFTEGKVIPLP